MFEDDNIDDELKDARCKLGIFPMREGHIKRFTAKTHDMFNVYNMDLFNSPVFAQARIDVAKLFFTNNLRFDVNEIEVLETKMAADTYCHIMWITTREANVKKIFWRSAQVKREDLRLFMFSPRSMHSCLNGIEIRYILYCKGLSNRPLFQVFIGNIF